MQLPFVSKLHKLSACTTTLFFSQNWDSFSDKTNTPHPKQTELEERDSVLKIAATVAESPQPRARVMHSMAGLTVGRHRDADAEPRTGRGLVVEGATGLEERDEVLLLILNMNFYIKTTIIFHIDGWFFAIRFSSVGLVNRVILFA